MGQRPAPVRNHLRACAAAADCLDRQRAQDRLLELVRAALDPEIRPHCLGVSRAGEVLSLVLDSAAWATRVRYLAGVLAATLGEDVCTSVRVRVRPAPRSQGARAAPSAPRRLTPVALGHILAAAETMDDPGLAEAFRRMARRHRGPDAP